MLPASNRRPQPGDAAALCRRHSWPRARTNDQTAGAAASLFGDEVQTSLTLHLVRQQTTLRQRLERTTKRYEKAQQERADLAAELGAAREENASLSAALTHALALGSSPSAQQLGARKWASTKQDQLEESRAAADGLRRELEHARRQLALAVAEKETAWSTVRRARESALATELRKDGLCNCSCSSTAFETDSSVSASWTPNDERSSAHLFSTASESSLSIHSTAPPQQRQGGAVGALQLAHWPAASAAPLSPTGADAPSRAAREHGAERGRSAVLELAVGGLSCARTALVRGQAELRHQLRVAYFACLSVQHRRQTPQHVLQQLMSQLMRMARTAEVLSQVIDRLTTTLSSMPPDAAPAEGGAAAPEPPAAAPPLGLSHVPSLLPPARAAPAESAAASASAAAEPAPSPGSAAIAHEGGSAFALGGGWRWLDDRDASACAACARDFHWLFRRRHHCRSCGHIFCNECSAHRQLLCALEPSSAVRICAECYRQMREDEAVANANAQRALAGRAVSPMRMGTAGTVGFQPPPGAAESVGHALGGNARAEGSGMVGASAFTAAVVERVAQRNSGASGQKHDLFSW